ncbi:MAG TPA: hypothetical protein VHY91_08625 [Pirellulales bacterium]|jgi:hypothetical protein|nr:hypothetical protein [Pirellulales bacterium]
MDRFHNMLIEDEVLLCGLVLVLGMVAGAAGRLVANFWKRSDA